MDEMITDPNSKYGADEKFDLQKLCIKIDQENLLDPNFNSPVFLYDKNIAIPYLILESENFHQDCKKQY